MLNRAVGMEPWTDGQGQSSGELFTLRQEGCEEASGWRAFQANGLFSLCKSPVVQKLGIFKDLSSHVAGAGRVGWGCVRGETQSQHVSKAICGQEFGSEGAGEVELKFTHVAYWC